MIRLNTTTRSLRAFLAGAITTNQLAVTVGYSDGTSAAYTGAAQLSLTNGVTPVTICAAPASGVVRHIDYIAVSNTDTAAATVTIQLNDNGTFYEQVKATLAAGRQLVYTHASGWNVGDVNATPIGANPSASVGLAAVNGTALTFMRSDAAPPLDQAIVPTWTGAHTWSAAAIFNGTVQINNNLTTTGNTTLGNAVGDTLNVGNGGLTVDASGNVGVRTSSGLTGLDVGDGTLSAISTRTNSSSSGSAVVQARVAGVVSAFLTSNNSGSTVNGIPTGCTGIGSTNSGASVVFTSQAVDRLIMDSAGNCNFTNASLYPSTPAKATQSTAAIYAGSGVPSSLNGNNGDFYFRGDTPGTANQRLYVKSGGAWVGIL